MMQIRYSISLWNFMNYAQSQSLERELAAIRATGYGVELWGWWGKERDLYDPLVRPRLQGALAGMPVSLHSAIVHSFEAQQKQIDAARALGADVLVVHSDEFFVDGRREIDLALCRDVVAYAAEQGVRIALENGQLPILARAVEAIDALRICLDVGHVYLTDQPMQAFLDAFKERIIHLHLQDILTPAEVNLPNTGKDHYIPGTGGIPLADWQLLVSVLNEVNYDGLGVFEVRPRNPMQTALLGRRFFDSLLDG